jgi:hypothetical protein
MVFNPLLLLVGSTLGTALVSLVVVLYPNPSNIDLGLTIRTEHVAALYYQLRWFLFKM